MMKRILALATLVFVQGPPPPDYVAQNGVLDSPDLGRYEIQGVCEVTTQDVHCWTPDGTPDPKLTELANAHLLVNGPNGLQFRYKGRTQFVVTRFSPLESGNGWISPNGLQNERRSGLNFCGLFNGSDFGNGNVSSYWYYPEPDETKADFFATVNVPLGRQARLTLQPGATTTLAKYRIGILSVTKVPKNRPPGYPYDNYYGGIEPSKVQLWEIKYSITPDNDKVPALQIASFGEGDRQIGDVDANGKPIFPSSRPGLSRMNVYWTSTGSSWITNVDPKYVKYLDLSGYFARTVQFKDIAIAPK